MARKPNDCSKNLPKCAKHQARFNLFSSALPKLLWELRLENFAAEKISQLRLENFAAAKIRSYKIRFATENFVYNFGATKFSENLKFRRITSKLRLDFFRKIRYNTITVNKEKRGIPNVYNLFRYGRYNC